jgi:predicted peptidase
MGFPCSVRILAASLGMMPMTFTPARSEPIPDPISPDYAAAPWQPWEQKFQDFAFAAYRKDGHVLPYRLHRPATIEPGRKYPLVLFFHGAGERGVDNRKQFQRFASVVEFWKTTPCFVLAPQCPEVGKPANPEHVWVQTPFGGPRHTMNATPSWPMRLAMDVFEKTIAENPVDPDRIYVTGLSMGGFATWEILQREGDQFAAAIPVCGGADLAYAKALSRIPIWVFHGDADDTVKVERSRDMVAALEAAGGHPKYTEYPGVGHDCWSVTYANPAVWKWLFAQVKK